jgi:putative ABC transport system ATP-binding protein
MLIALENIQKVYDTGEFKVPALAGVSFRIAAGEFVAIMGASGSGKSTLMNILGFLDRPTAGVYRFEDHDVSQLDRDARARLRRTKLGFVFQGFNLLKRQTAVENVELPLLYAGVPARERRERALRTLERVGLAQRARHLPSQLSGGQQQRVAIARALVNNPQVLLADEPTGNLDSRAGKELLADFQRMHVEHQQTILLVTHDPLVAKHADRVLTMRDGRVAADEMNAHSMEARGEDHRMQPKNAAMHGQPAAR